jgi:hypothetical protein
MELVRRLVELGRGPGRGRCEKPAAAGQSAELGAWLGRPAGGPAGRGARRAQRRGADTAERRRRTGSRSRSSPTTGRWGGGSASRRNRWPTRSGRWTWRRLSRLPDGDGVGLAGRVGGSDRWRRGGGERDPALGLGGRLRPIGHGGARSGAKPRAAVGRAAARDHPIGAGRPQERRPRGERPDRAVVADRRIPDPAEASRTHQDRFAAEVLATSVHRASRASRRGCRCPTPSSASRSGPAGPEPAASTRNEIYGVIPGGWGCRGHG